MLWYASLAPRQILPEALRKAVLTKGVLNLSTSILRILRKAMDDEWTATHFSMMKYIFTSKGKHMSLLQKIITLNRMLPQQTLHQRSIIPPDQIRFSLDHPFSGPKLQMSMLNFSIAQDPQRGIELLKAAD
ncbi:hypothetical protein DPX16_11639 [Anabarilius grahami]|uniref:Uncharacterized protein n=1 Tax=Anabarilius grahami TaxID=495550 RepID=A0A3N0Z4K5_ANAGA|nr:hypothetical protein DPX16_11639 [Anabarilius grahami]